MFEIFFLRLPAPQIAPPHEKSALNVSLELILPLLLNYFQTVGLKSVSLLKSSHNDKSTSLLLDYCANSWTGQYFTSITGLLYEQSDLKVLHRYYLTTAQIVRLKSISLLLLDCCVKS